MLYYGHDAMVALTVDGLDVPVVIRVTDPETPRPGDRAGIRIIGRAALVAS